MASLRRVLYLALFFFALPRCLGALPSLQTPEGSSSDRNGNHTSHPLVPVFINVSTEATRTRNQTYASANDTEEERTVSGFTPGPPHVNWPTIKIPPEPPIVIVEEIEDPSKYSVFGYELPVCPVTCGGRCWSSRREDMGGCFCDPSCELYGDCCIDYYLYCKSIDLSDFKKDSGTTVKDRKRRTQRLESSLKSAYQTFIVPFQADRKCQEVRRLGGGSDKLAVTSNCPGTVSVEHQLDKDLCENPDQLSIADRFTLVYEKETSSPARLFQNVHCAKCHGVPANSSAVRFLPPRFSCGRMGVQAEAVLRQFGQQAFYEFLTDNCAPGYNPGIRNNHLICFSTDERISTCDPALADDLPDYDLLQTACATYTSQVFSEGAEYKNPHCALCNGVSQQSESACIDEPNKSGSVNGPSLPSFSILMDFEGSAQFTDYGGRKICLSDSYLDVASDKCVLNNCSSGQIQLDGVCTDLNVSFPSLERSLSNIQTAVNLIFRLEKSADSLRDGVPYMTVTLEYAKGLPEVLNVSLDENCSVITDFIQSLNRNDSASVVNVSSNLCVVVKLASPGTINYSTLRLLHGVYGVVTLTSVGWWTRSKILDEVSNLGVLARDPVVDVLGLHLLNSEPKESVSNECPNGSHTQTASSSQEATMIEKSREGTSHLAIMSELYDFAVPYNNTLTLLSWTPRAKSKFEEWGFKFLTVFCEPNILICNRFLLTKNKLEIEGDLIRPKGYNSWIGLNDFAYTSKDDVLVCEEALRSAERVDIDSGSAIEGILTLAGISLSLLGLAVTLVTYSSFASLRNVPGLNIMNLSVALFLAQLLFELCPLASDCGWLCMAAGALQHYSWLAAFLWMNVMAYDVCRTFVSMQSKGGNQSGGNSSFRVYCVYSWGCPVLVVGVCLALHYTPQVSVSYMDFETCWLEAGNVLLVALGVPMALVVACNVAFFVQTAIALKEAMAVSKKIASTSSTKGDFKMYTIYLKLASLMGITWILGFAAALADIDIITYVFIATNSMQGLFICLSFVATGKVLKLIKKKCCLGQGRDASDGNLTRISRLSQVDSQSGGTGST